jgi:signal transduction histidine kinase
MSDTLAPVPILLVDDLPENLLSLEALLKRDDITLIKARSGEEALEILLSRDVALALLDVQMPDMNGFELAEFMRGSARARHIPIIFVTAGTTDSARRFRGYEAGAVDFIQKPIEADVLRSKVNVFFDLYRQRQQIEAATQALASAAGKLEIQVAERTAELEATLARLKEEVAERERVEAALLQVQKMEAVGQLTGGIAHDFNNMLMGIIGSMDMMKRRIAAGRHGEIDRFMDAAYTSAQRAAALTARLLAFSRRQPLDSHPTDVNALLASLEDLLDRTMDERVDVSIVAAKALPQALVDANQLENAILNLAINARDAMPDGGKLTIETSLVELDESHPGIAPGHYIAVAVSDTGEGMDADTLARVFEPFFTTKPIGKGTGLGLSMVYGFAKQSNGHVRIHSTPGIGTTVRIFLPPAEDQAPRADGDATGDVQEGQGQHLLLVEDDASVRLLMREALSELGYNTAAAARPEDAIALLRSDRSFDLMISDVGLPDMNGRELADIARDHAPDLPILFVTGYAENAMDRAKFLGPNMAMIVKPFTIELLSAKIAEMLPRSAS